MAPKAKSCAYLIRENASVKSITFFVFIFATLHIIKFTRKAITNYSTKMWSKEKGRIFMCTALRPQLDRDKKVSLIPAGPCSL